MEYFTRQPLAIASDVSFSAELPQVASVPSNKRCQSGLIINADDWGRDNETTDRSLDCVLRGSVSSVSAMMFMEDSERAAGIARRGESESSTRGNIRACSMAVAPPKALVLFDIDGTLLRRAGPQHR